MSLSQFKKRLKEAQEGGDRISKLVKDEADMKAKLLHEAGEQNERLKQLGEAFQELRQQGGDDLGTPS